MKPNKFNSEKRRKELEKKKKQEEKKKKKLERREMEKNGEVLPADDDETSDEGEGEDGEDSDDTGDDAATETDGINVDAPEVPAGQDSSEAESALGA